MFFAQHAFAHGYLADPPSRGLLCSDRAGAPQNFNCGRVTWEPQSLEGKQTFPQTGAPDGQIASAGDPTFAELDEQTADRWKITDLKPGAKEFKWKFAAAHRTKEFKYYLTKEGWNPNKPLTRDQFDLTPICTIDGGMKLADEVGPHNCVVPTDRKGHHVLLTTWHVGDTTGMFYNVADVNITDDGGTTEPGKPDWSTVGTLMPTLDLEPGDKVVNRVFKSTGEVPTMKTTVTVGTAEQGERNMWPMLLATEINKTQSANLIAGVERDGQVKPALGKNDVFAKKGSGIVRTETTVVKKPEGGIDENFSISNNADFQIKNGKATAKFFLKFNHMKDTNVTVKLYDAHNGFVGSKTQTMRGQGDVLVNIDNAKPGQHTAVATSQIDGGRLMQQDSTFKLVGESGGGEGAQCQAAWDKVTAYTGGGKVQHNGRTYEARWWTQGDLPGDPATTGPDHSGKVWKDLGACSK